MPDLFLGATTPTILASDGGPLAVMTHGATLTVVELTARSHPLDVGLLLRLTSAHSFGYFPSLRDIFGPTPLAVVASVAGTARVILACSPIFVALRSSLSR